MATKIIIKNSSVPDKEPDAGALERGELAVNLVDRKLYTKDANDEVFSFSSAGEVPGGGTGDRPTSPNVGDLYYDTDLNALLYWNGTDWEQVTSETPGAGGEYVKLDDGGVKQVIRSAGLGLSDGTDENITLGSNGNGTFAGSITNTTFSSGDGYKIDSAGAIYVRADSLPATSEAIGIYRNGGAAANAVTSLKNNGSGTFAGDIKIGGVLPSAPNITLSSSGSAEFAGKVRSTSDFECEVDGNDFHSFRSRVGSSGDWTAQIFGNGSASFKGVVDTKNAFTINHPGGTLGTTASMINYVGGSATYGLYANGDVKIGGDAGANPNIHLKNDGSTLFSGKVETVGDTAAFHAGIPGSAARVPLNIYDTDNGNASLARINGDGSALFTGTVTCDVSGVRGSSLNTTYGLTSYAVDASNSTYLARFTSGGGAGEVASIRADGKITAKSFDLESLQELS